MSKWRFRKSVLNRRMPATVCKSQTHAPLAIHLKARPLFRAIPARPTCTDRTHFPQSKSQAANGNPLWCSLQKYPRP